MSYLYQQKRKIGGKVVKSKAWRGRYRLPGDVKVNDVSLETTDKEVAASKLRRIVQELEREREGMIAPKAVRDGVAKRWIEVVGLYLRELATLGRDARYIEGLRYQLRTLGEECKWAIVRDVSAESFCDWRDENCSKSPKTRNEYLTAASAVMSWLVKRRMAPANPLSVVEKVATHGEKTLLRRALGLEELVHLLRIAGPRRVVYLVAAKTGLRRGELEKLKWGDVVLDGPRPMIRLRAAVSKNRRTGEQPIDSEVVEALRALRGAAPDSARVFDRLLPRMPRFRADLKAAGIPFQDDAKRRADFHALRMTFNMLIDGSGANGRTAMELMRHSDPKLTFNNYNDRTKLPKWEVVNSLPALLAGKKSDTLQSTLPHDILRPSVSPAVTDAENDDRPESLMDKGFWPEMAPNGTHCQNGKMVRAAGFEPATSCV